MVHGVDGILLRRLPVRGGVGDHIASHHHIDLAPCKYLLQPSQVRGVCNIHRNVIGEQVDMELVSHRHIDNLTADQVGLRLFGPGELVYSQIDLITQIPDLPHNSLVGEGERVKGSREKGYLFSLLNLHLADCQAVGRDEPADVGER